MLPQAIAIGHIHIGTMIGKLKGVMPTQTPSGRRSIVLSSGMFSSRSRRLDAGAAPEVEAAIVKDLGTRFERAVAEALRLALPLEPEASGAPAPAAALGASLLALPSFTLRGGTNEILRSIIARGLGLR